MDGRPLEVAVGTLEIRPGDEHPRRVVAGDQGDRLVEGPHRPGELFDAQFAEEPMVLLARAESPCGQLDDLVGPMVGERTHRIIRRQTQVLGPATLGIPVNDLLDERLERFRLRHDPPRLIVASAPMKAERVPVEGAEQDHRALGTPTGARPHAHAARDATFCLQAPEGAV